MDWELQQGKELFAKLSIDYIHQMCLLSVLPSGLDHLGEVLACLQALWSYGYCKNNYYFSLDIFKF